jgi:hypothetical protein
MMWQKRAILGRRRFYDLKLAQNAGLDRFTRQRACPFAQWPKNGYVQEKTSGDVP